MISLSPVVARTSRSEALEDLGDFVGGIAVIATLVHLAIQIRQKTVAPKTTS